MMIRIDDVMFPQHDLKLAIMEKVSIHGQKPSLVIKLTISTGNGTVTQAAIQGSSDEETRNLLDKLTKLTEARIL